MAGLACLIAVIIDLPKILQVIDQHLILTETPVAILQPWEA
jgi:hypothetical protein